MKKATLLSIGISSEAPYHIACIERDAEFVALQHELAYDRLPRYKDYPVHKWETITHADKYIIPLKLIDLFNIVPINETMRFYFSGHGFIAEIDGKKKYCLWLGNKDCWITFDALLLAINSIAKDPKVKRFSIWLDTCFSGVAKKSIKHIKQYKKYLYGKDTQKSLKASITLAQKYIEPFGKFDIDNTIKTIVKPHKKISIWTACRGKQTSYANFEHNDLFMSDTNDNSLGTLALVTSLNFYWNYAPKQWLQIKGKRVRPRSDWAVTTLTNERIKNEIHSLGLAEWRNYEPKTTEQVSSTKGKALYY